MIKDLPLRKAGAAILQKKQISWIERKMPLVKYCARLVAKRDAALAKSRASNG